MVAFIESIQVETLRAQNTGKIGHGDDVKIGNTSRAGDGPLFKKLT